MKYVIPIVFVLILAATSLPAQEAAGEPLPLRNGMEDSVQGVFVTPVEGAPFSAIVEIRKEVLYADGSIVTLHTLNEIARDNSGRIHNEIRQMMPEGFTDVPEIREIHIFDPQTHLNTYYDLQTHVASQRVLPRSPIDMNARFLATHKPQSRDLGTTVLNGIECRGTLKTYTLLLRGKDADKPETVTDELWYSEDLHINILMDHKVSSGGGQTVAVLQIKREPPDPALFEVPEGYKIVDVTPPRSTFAGQPQARK